MNARVFAARRLMQIGVFAALFHCLLALLLSPLHAAGGGQAPIRIVVLGDSLTAGFRLATRDAFPVKLEKALRAQGHAVEVTNAGVSGDTTAAGLERLD